jgi:hypothetical protein
MKYFKLTLQFIFSVLCFALLVSHLASNQLMILLENPNIAVMILLFPVITLGSVFIPISSLAFAGDQSISIFQILFILLFCTIWIIIIEKLFKLINTSRKKGIYSIDSYNDFRILQKIYLFEVILYSFFNIFTIIFLNIRYSNEVNDIDSMIAFNSLFNIIFALPYFQLVILITVFFLGILYKNNINLKKEQDLFI